MSETDTQDQEDFQADHDEVLDDGAPDDGAPDDGAPDDEAPDEAGTDVVQVVDFDGQGDSEDDEDDEDTAIRALAIRHVLERQLVASQSLTEQLVEAATDVSAAVVHAPAIVVDEIRGGATLPTAFANTGTAVREVVNTAGGRVRTAVGEYVDGRATLPKAVVVGAADVAESVVRAQGTVAANAITGAFTVAGVAVRGGDVREALGDERQEVRATAVAAREQIVESWRHAREHVEAARSIG
jgi:hypothetical protein